jgi:hypothetical protein
VTGLGGFMYVTSFIVIFDNTNFLDRSLYQPTPHTSHIQLSPEFDKAWLGWLVLHQRKKAQQLRARDSPSWRKEVDNEHNIAEKLLKWYLPTERKRFGSSRP